MGDETVLKERKEKLIRFLKSPKIWVVGILLIAIILGVYIRSMPMNVRADTGKPGLWDITRDDWTLGPDLDPWFFTRYAKTIVEDGGLPDVDMMRNVPLGFEPSRGTILLPYMISYTHKFVSVFSDVPVEYSAALFPVIMFAFTIISFFLFVREIFTRKSKKAKTRANIIALISTFFMIVIPIFVSRTIAGIPEKESAGFFFMFLAFWLFLRAWKSDGLKKSLIFGGLAGVSTALMGLIWGGVSYVFVTIAIASLIAFILNKIHKKEFLVYGLWLGVSWVLMILLSDMFSLKGLITSLDTGLAFLVFFITVVHFVLWNTQLSKIKFLQKIKLPKNIISFIVAIVLGFFGVLILFGPGFIIEKIKAINQMMFRPITGRWNTTVAENRQPYFTEWGASFGPHIRNIPVLFWMFFIGSVVLFKKMLSKLKQKDSWILTGFYILLFFGLVFSRYAPHPHIFDGENFISKFIYYGSALLLIGFAVYIYNKYNKEGDKSFEKISYEYLFLFSLFMLTLFTARGAVRLIMVLAPVSVIFAAYLIIFCIEKFRKSDENIGRIIFVICAILVIILGIFIFWGFFNSAKAQASMMIPSMYNQQWQKAMGWVRSSTPTNAVFAHWWDYGYWVQSIGERATVLDGGNVITYWNYLMGRYVLTGDNQEDALEFLYNHNSTHLLIDSSDIGKYGAFSVIGSDENYDRYSQIPVMVSNPQQSRETADGMEIVYLGGYATDEDIFYEENTTKIFLPAGVAGVAGIIIETKRNDDSITFKQPTVVFSYNNQQYRIPLRYIYVNNQFYDFGSGLEGCVYVIPRVYQSGQSLQKDDLGALIWISPRVLRGYLAQKYLLDDPFDNFPNFEIAHVEQNFIVESLNNQGIEVGEFVIYGDLQGPIKIWDVKYTGDEQLKEEYLDTDASKYLDWEL